MAPPPPPPKSTAPPPPPPQQQSIVTQPQLMAPSSSMPKMPPSIEPPKRINSSQSELFKSQDQSVNEESNKEKDKIKLGFYYYSRGKDLLNKGDYEGALHCFRSLNELNQYNTKCLHLCGIALYRLKEYNEAITYIDRSIEINPYDDLMYESKGDCYKALEKYDEALEFYLKALELNPNNVFNLTRQR